MCTDVLGVDGGRAPQRRAEAQLRNEPKRAQAATAGPAHAPPSRGAPHLRLLLRWRQRQSARHGGGGHGGGGGGGGVVAALVIAHIHQAYCAQLARPEGALQAMKGGARSRGPSGWGGLLLRAMQQGRLGGCSSATEGGIRRGRAKGARGLARPWRCLWLRAARVWHARVFGTRACLARTLATSARLAASLSITQPPGPASLTTRATAMNAPE
jgi:hypothetical protein